MATLTEQNHADLDAVVPIGTTLFQRAATRNLIGNVMGEIRVVVKCDARSRLKSSLLFGPVGIKTIPNHFTPEVICFVWRFRIGRNFQIGRFARLAICWRPAPPIRHPTPDIQRPVPNYFALPLLPQRTCPRSYLTRPLYHQTGNGQTRQGAGVAGPIP